MTKTIEISKTKTGVVAIEKEREGTIYKEIDEAYQTIIEIEKERRAYEQLPKIIKKIQKLIPKLRSSV